VSDEIELEIAAGEEPCIFQVRVLQSAATGHPRARLILDADAILGRRAELEEALIFSATPPRRPNTSTAEQPNTSTAEQHVQQVGRELFEALFTGPVHDAYRASVRAAQGRGRRLRVVLRLTAQQLADLPWEAMFDPQTRTYLCRQEPLVRRVDASHVVGPLEMRPPLRILGLVAGPIDLPQLSVELEQQSLEEALQQPLSANLVEVTWALDASWRTVHQLMLRGGWHVLHFVGHSAVTNGEGIFALVGPDGRADMVEAARFADLLLEADPIPRLVVLNTVSSSRTAAALVQRGISAAVAMQFAISDEAAIRFTRGFYTALAHGRAVDEASRSGRIAMLGGSQTLEWITPVLYVRGSAAQIFALTATETRSRSYDRPVAELPLSHESPPAPTSTGPELDPGTAKAADEPAAFMSYVRFDDQHDDGQITQFRERLGREVRAQTGDEFAIFQDRSDIAWGQNWQRRINEALDAATLLLVIITPSLFRSGACRAEVNRFLERERALGRQDLILPVYYISAREMDDPGLQDADEMARVLASRQYADWRGLRFKPFSSPPVRKAIAQLATRMRDTFWQRPAAPNLPTPAGPGQNGMLWHHFGLGPASTSRTPDSAGRTRGDGQMGTLRKGLPDGLDGHRLPGRDGEVRSDDQARRLACAGPRRFSDWRGVSWAGTSCRTDHHARGYLAQQRVNIESKQQGSTGWWTLDPP